MKRYAYCRVSTTEQNLDLQLKAIKAKYPRTKVFTEKASGANTKGRPQLEEILRHIDKGDKLVVWRLDRLARSMNDLCQIINKLDEVGASLEIIDQAIDTSTSSGKAFLQMLGVFAEFETNIRKERQIAGIEAAKAKGVYQYKNRKPRSAPTTHKIEKLLIEGWQAKDISEKTGCAVQTVYNVKSKLKRSALV